jgi:4-amino-4-deoxy-L-arabinose transferase-like glycosyltransferase
MQQLNLDESIMYPIVIKMLTAGEGLRASLYRFLVYGDYIYGFPFYGWSAFVLLPVKWLGEEGFAERLQLNMLLVRQLANVLPAVLSCFLFTWLATRFKNLWASLGLNLILLTLPGMIGLNYTFWHPDGVNLFFVALTLYYLDRDRLRFGANFYFAALACGASIATRLFGGFFFLAIAVLLLMGWQKKTLTLRRGLLAGLFFILVMAAGIFISNPYMFAPGEIGAALNTLARRQAVLAQGVAGPDPEGIYRTGLDAWWPFMAPTFGSSLTIIFLTVSTLAGLFNRERRHFTWALFAWLLVIGTYMIATVKVKSPWYLLPFLIPLYCSTFNLPDLLRQKLALSSTGGQKKVWRIAVWILVAGLGAAQLVQNIHILGTSLIFQ